MIVGIHPQCQAPTCAYEFFAVGMFLPALFEVLSRVVAIDCSGPVLWVNPTIGLLEFKGSTVCLLKQWGKRGCRSW